MILSAFQAHPLKRFLTLLFICFVGLTFISTSFISCGPGFDNPGSEDDGGDGDDGEEEENDDDRDDGDTCRGNETCEEVCEKIYEEYAEARKCFDEGDLKVGRIQRVHNLLMGNIGTDGDFNSGRDKDELLRDLEVISDSDEDDDDEEAVRPVDLEYYLELGATKYITAIKNGLGGSDSNSKLKLLVTTLKWMIDNEEIADQLEDVNDGSEILEELLLNIRLADSSNCLSNETPSGSVDDSQADTDLWGLSISGKNLTVTYRKGNNVTPNASILLDKNSDARLYDALSCISVENRNVFSYSAQEDNETIFNMAFDLLDKICEDVTTEKDKNKACAKIMMCWTAWKVAGESSPGQSDQDDEIWNMAEEHKSKLDPNANNYKRCYADDFSEFF